VHCSQAHTELLIEEFELGMLWDEYGLVGDIVVCIRQLSTVAGSLTFFNLFSHSLPISHELILMSFCHPTSYTN
jgi:hypothetical protein